MTGCFINCCALIGNSAAVTASLPHRTMSSTAPSPLYPARHYTQPRPPSSAAHEAWQAAASAHTKTWQSPDTSPCVGLAFAEGAQNAFTRNAESRLFIRGTTRGALVGAEAAVPCWGCAGAEASPC